ncbi:MAG: trans-aconitate 2-methyltransferase [Candidatus Competibacterales bacterium]
MGAVDWNPACYETFATERTRPAKELLHRVAVAEAKTVLDLGCGSGTSTALLVARWPSARVEGVDTSEAMVAKARQRLPRVAFHLADVGAFVPGDGVDVVFANAVFHWLPDHGALLPRWLRSVNPGGALALQMPDNLAEPSHRAMVEVAEHGPWAEELASATAARTALASAEVYYDWLIPQAETVDIWRTVYHHVLPGPEAVVAWFMATGLKPFVDPLPEPQRQAYLDAYRERLGAAYPPRADGKVLLRFPRLFIVATR